MKIIKLSLALIVAAVLQVQAQDPFTNGLVAYYPFKGNANDVSGNGSVNVPADFFPDLPFTRVVPQIVSAFGMKFGLPVHHGEEPL